MTRPRRAAADKVVERHRLREALAEQRGRGRTVVFTNGCFDLLHPGHVELLEQAGWLGDVLVVGLNDDASVRRLKGAERPFQPFDVRARLLAAIEPVDWVVGFAEDTPAELIEAVQPDVLVKGGDWAPDAVVGRDTVEARGGRVVTVPLVTDQSTTGIVERIRRRRPTDP